MTIDTTWLGWSGFLLVGGKRVAVDPHWSSWTKRGELPPWDLTPLDGIVLSHGHPDHCGDVPALMSLHPSAWLAVGPGLAGWAKTLDLGRRLFVLGEELPTEIDGVTVTLLPGEHVGEGLAVQARSFARYFSRRPVSALQLLAAAASTPRGGTHAVLLELPEGTVLHASETLHQRTNLSLWQRQVEGREVDVLLLGVEPGEESSAAKAGAMVGAGRVIAFSPHERQREHFRVRRDVAWSRVQDLLPVERAIRG